MSAANLYTPGDGILQTHVSWEEIESQLQKALKTEATFGEFKSAVNLSFGKGLLSRIVLITPQWQGAKESETLPESIVVKIASLMNGIDLMEAMRAKGEFVPMAGEELYGQVAKTCLDVHNIECSLYKFAMDNKLLAEWMPKVYALREFDENNKLKGYVIMDYIQSDDVHIYENISFEELKQVLKAVAQFSAIGEKMDVVTARKFHRKMFTEVFGPLIKENTKQEAVDSLRKFDNGSLADIIDDYEKVYMEAISTEKLINEIDNLAESLGMKPTLVHGDLHSMNLMWKRQDDGTLKLKAVVDYQMTHFNCAALDLARLVVSTMSGKERRDHYEEMIEVYYDYFITALDGKSAPYTLEQLKKACNIALPYAAMMLAPMIQPLYASVAAQDSDDKDIILDRIREKVRCIVEDATSYYKKNNQK